MAVVLATTMLASLMWLLVRVIWFVHTSAYCASTTCIGSAIFDGPAMRTKGIDTDLMVRGEEALRAAGISELILVLSYFPLTIYAFGFVVVLLAVAALAWGWSPATWRAHWRTGSARAPVLVASWLVLGVAGFVLLYLVNWQSMLWVFYVVTES